MNIDIENVNVDWQRVPDVEALTAAIRAQINEPIDSQVLSAVGTEISQSLSSQLWGRE